jgi:hypothetical protein
MTEVEQAELEALESADQPLEDSAQETATQTAEDSAQQTATQTDQDGAGQEADGLKAGIVAERNKRQEIEAQLEQERQARLLAEQQALYIRQQMQTPVEQPADDEYVQYGQLKQQQAMLAQQLQYQTFMSQHPDSAEVIGQGIGTGMFQPSEHLQKTLQANPQLFALQTEVARGNPQALMVAYQFAHNQKMLTEQQAKIAELQAAQASINEHEAAIAARTGVTSPLSVGGGGGTSLNAQLPDPNTPEGEDYFERMKAGEFD